MDATEQNTPADETSPSDERLRLMLPTAVTSAIAICDLIRVRTFYPDSITLDDAQQIHETLTEQLVSAVTTCGLSKVFETIQNPRFDDASSDEMSKLSAVLVMHHPDYKPGPAEPSDDFKAHNMPVLRNCLDTATEPVRGILKRIRHAMLYDCLMPAPKGDSTYREPQRHVQMLRLYWCVVRQLVLHYIDAPIGYPPLMPLVVNLKARIDACFEELSDVGSDDAREVVASLVDIVLSGEPDAISAVPERSHEQISTVDRFIEETSLKLGAKSYPLTSAEEMCLEQAKHEIREFERRVEQDWAKFMRRVDAQRDKTAKKATQPVCAVEDTELGEGRSDDQAAVRLLSLYTNGLADERFDEAASVLQNDRLTIGEKLTKIDALMPIPPTISAAKLGKALGVSKTAVQNTTWYVQKRKGQKDNEISRRHEQHRQRGQQYEPDRKTDNND